MQTYLVCDGLGLGFGLCFLHLLGLNLRNLNLFGLGCHFGHRRGDSHIQGGLRRIVSSPMFRDVLDKPSKGHTTAVTVLVFVTSSF